ncbi:MAG TPA: Gfo/Idh/MocA family oxidoreductase [Gemmatimonas sp.]|nr:Gfo/Idh/MocA family oxidoreductase [Gemmatimonas sp.]
MTLLLGSIDRASTARPAEASPSLRPPQSTLRCVVVGAGSIGRRHLRNLTALGVECAALRTMAGQSGPLDGWPVLRAWDEVAEFQAGIAVIANPTAYHVDAALAAIRIGCHILVEKPVADRLSVAMELEEAVRRAGTVALVGYQFRFHPSLRAVQQWVAAGLIGTPMAAHAHWGEFLPSWHAGENHLDGYSARSDLGGGVVRTLSHPIDYLRWILGEIVSVSAVTARAEGISRDVEDVASLTLRMRSGGLATVTLDYVERPVRHWLGITGSRGTISWDALSGCAELYDIAGVCQRWTLPESGFERNSMFMDEARHLLACIEGAERPLCTLQDGVRAVAIAEAALQSAREGRVIDV